MDYELFKTRLLSLSKPPSDNFWGRIRVSMRGHVASGEPLDTFLTWPEIVTTMFVGNAPYTGLELYALAHSPDWERYRLAMKEDALGSPPMYDTYTSGNLIHQCYHLMMWERETGLKVDNLNSIIEIGAGYGALCKIIRRLGYTGEYLIFDLPELKLLQEWYLGELGIAATWAEHMPAQALKPDLLIALWSLSEMHAEIQMEYTQAIEPKHYLVSRLDSDWEGRDNKTLFNLLSHFCKTAPIAHLPGNLYLLG